MEGGSWYTKIDTVNEPSQRNFSCEKVYLKSEIVPQLSTILIVTLTKVIQLFTTNFMMLLRLFNAINFLLQQKYANELDLEKLVPKLKSAPIKYSGIRAHATREKDTTLRNCQQ